MDERTDEELLMATAREPAAFGVFYLRYAEAMLAFFAVRTRQPDVAADLAAETFAAALRGTRRYRPAPDVPAAAWLFSIARRKLVDAARRGVVADRARRKLAMEPFVVTDDDLERVEALADLAAGGAGSLMAFVDALPVTQREAVVAHILDERGYPEIALFGGGRASARQPRARDAARATRRRRGADVSSDLVRRMGDALMEAAERQAARPRGLAFVRARLRWPRRASTRALVVIGAVVVAGAGGTAGVLAARGHVGGPPSLTFGRVSAAQQAAGISALTRPVVFARGRLPDNGRLWQLVGFSTSRGFCIDVDWPHAGQSGGCGTNVPRERRVIDYQGEIALRAGTQRVVYVGAIAPDVATVRLVYRVTLHSTKVVGARVVHVDDPRVLQAMGLEQPFAYYVAEQVGSGAFQARVVAYDRGGRELGRAGIPNGVSDTPGGFFNVPGQGCVRSGPIKVVPPRIVHTPAPAAVRARFAPLRRAQRPGDLPPKRFRDGFPGLTATIDVAEMRRLGQTVEGDTVYLVPQTIRLPPMTPPAGCLNTVSPRGQALEEQREARARAVAAQRAHSLTSVLVHPGGPSGGSGPSFDLGAWDKGEMAAVIAGNEVIGLVPDGVARVDLYLHHGVHLVSAVHENTWSVRTKTNGGETWPTREVWRDARGRVLRTLRRG